MGDSVADLMDAQRRMQAQKDSDEQATADARRSAILAQFRTGRNQDLAEGRARGQELFGEGSNATRAAPEIKTDVMDILNRRKEALQGFTSPEQTALRSQMLNQITRNGQTASRQLRGQQAASGVRGAVAGAQQNELLKSGNQAKTQAEKDLYLQNLANKGTALENYEKTVGGELTRSQQEKYGQLSTELGFGQLGSAERSAAAQQAIGEANAKAAAEAAKKSQGKK